MSSVLQKNDYFLQLLLLKPLVLSYSNIVSGIITIVFIMHITIIFIMPVIIVYTSA